MESRLLTAKQVLGMIGIGRTTLYAMVKDGEFPRPIQITKGRVGISSEVEKWVLERAEQRGA